MHELCGFASLLWRDSEANIRVRGSARECRGIGKEARESPAQELVAVGCEIWSRFVCEIGYCWWRRKLNGKGGDIEALVRKKIKKIPKVAV
jgi:hypothetical protein